MPEVAITAIGLGGRAVRGLDLPCAVHVEEDAVRAFATRHHAELRWANRGTVLTAAVVDAVLTRRWPDPAARPAHLALVVGSAFGNQGETTRYFRRILGERPDQVPPMASYDVAVNSFVGLCSLLFRASGPVLMVSSGAVSALDALATAAGIVGGGEAEVAIVVGVEHDCPEACAHAGVPPEPGVSEGVAVLLLERARRADASGTLVDVASACVAPHGLAAARDALVAQLLDAHGISAVATVVAGGIEPDGLHAPHVARGPRAEPCPASPAAVGAVGALAAAVALQRAADAGPAGVGVAVAVDRDGWVAAALLRAPDGRTGPSGAREEVSPCPP